MLRVRVGAGAVLIALLTAAIWADHQFGPPYPCWLAVVLACMVGCCRELRQLLRRQGIRTGRYVTYGSVLALALSNWFDFALPGIAHRLLWPFVVLCVANMIVLLREAWMFKAPGSAVATASATSFIIFYLGVLGSFAAQLRFLAWGTAAVLTHIAVVKCGDSAAYFVGRAFGRHKLAPRLSPGKTIEGCAAGLICSVLAALAATWVANFSDSQGRSPLSWPAACIFGLAVGAFAQLGDLIESMIKRDSEQKDSSALVPGYGGVLDVLDSLLFSAPAAFGLWLWLGPGPV